MPLNARQYRDEAYRLRQHPGRNQPIPNSRVEPHESWSSLYFSILPFIALEYFLEARYEKMISGLVFPTGFLLFWAFFYSQFRPDDLEAALSSSKRNDLNRLPFLLLGTAIWLVKSVVMRVGRILGLIRKPRPQVFYTRRPVDARQSPPRPNPQSSQQRSAPRPPPPRQAPRPAPTPPGLPREVLDSLAILGLGPCRDWNQIHSRYRELAKKFHPDLHPEITSSGNRFITYDAAYKKLVAVKARYFFERRDRG